MTTLLHTIFSLPPFSAKEWETISEIISSLQGCELSLLLQKDDEEIDKITLENARKTKTPILIKHKNTLKIYGNPLGNENLQDWKYTEIKSNLSNLNTVEFNETINTIISTNPLLSPELRKILKQGHALLEQRTPQEFKKFIHENNITMDQATHDRIIKFLELWPIAVQKLISWNKEAAEKWEKIFHEAIATEDLLPLTIVSIPNTIQLSQFHELLTKLDQASYIEKGSAAFAITNFHSAIKAKLTDDKLDNDFLRKFTLYQLKPIYDQYNNYLLQCIKKETSRNPLLLHIYYPEMGTRFNNKLCTKEELNLLKSKYPEFVDLLTKYKVSIAILFSIERPENQASRKFTEVHKKLVYWKEMLSEPVKKQLDFSNYIFNQISFFHSSNYKDPGQVFIDKNKDIMSTMNSLIKEIEEPSPEKKPALTPTPYT